MYEPKFVEIVAFGAPCLIIYIFMSKLWIVITYNYTYDWVYNWVISFISLVIIKISLQFLKSSSYSPFKIIIK